MTEVHVDCDNIWSYEREFGYQMPGLDIFESAIQTFDELFRKYKIKAKFFVVGRDLLKGENLTIVNGISKHHDIGNHTFNHFSDYGTMDVDEVTLDIFQADQIIKECIEKDLKFFKSPGYSFRTDVHRFLVNELRYTNDYSPAGKTTINMLNIYAKIKGMTKQYVSPEYHREEARYLVNVVKHTEFKFINIIANSTTCLKTKSENRINSLIKGFGENNSFVFHAIDLVKTNKTSKNVPILNIPYNLRIRKVEKLIQLLSEQKFA